MMVRVPSCNIDRPIYIWRMEIKLKDTRTPIHICRQGVSSSSLYPTNLIIEQLRKEASGTNWPGGRCQRHQSPCLRSVRPPITTTPTPPHLISHLCRNVIFWWNSWDTIFSWNSRDIISFYTWDYSCMGQSQQVFCKKMHIDVPCNARESCL